MAVRGAYEAGLWMALAVSFGGLGGWGWSRLSAPETVSLEDPGVLEAVRAAARAAETQAAYTDAQEPSLRAYLNLMATELGLLSEPARFIAAGSEGGVGVVALRWTLRGDPLDLPPLLEAFGRQRHVVLVDRVEVRADPDQPRGATIAVRARLLRPLLPDRDHMLRVLRTQTEVPAAGHSLLLAAAELHGWRRFTTADAAGRVEARVRARALLRELPAALIEAREQGTVLRWAAGTGIVRATVKKKGPADPERTGEPTPAGARQGGGPETGG